MLALHNITFSYNDTPLLNDISLVLKEGDCVAITGPNGSGKSTLLRIAAGLLQPNTGYVQYKDYDLCTIPLKKQAHIRSYLGPEPLCHWDMRVYDLLTLQPISQKAMSIFKDLGVDTLFSRSFFSLSSGEKALTLVARALSSLPQILIADELFGYMSPQLWESTFKTLKQLAKKGMTILFISHQIDLLKKTNIEHIDITNR